VGDERAVIALVERVCAGEATAWTELFAALAGPVERRVRGSRSFVGFRRSEDDVRDVVTAVFERMRRDQSRALHRYRDWQTRHPERSFEDWLTIVTTNVIRDHVATRLGRGLAGERVVAIDEIAVPGEADGISRRRHGSATLTSIAEIVTAAARKLTPGQAGALDDWLQGFDYAEIATRRGEASARDAERQIRAALARLRRHLTE
jgi:hypothetical protein